MVDLAGHESSQLADILRVSLVLVDVLDDCLNIEMLGYFLLQSYV